MDSLALFEAPKKIFGGWALLVKHVFSWARVVIYLCNFYILKVICQFFACLQFVFR